VKPSHNASSSPTRKNADVIIPGDKEFDKCLYMLNAIMLYELVSKPEWVDPPSAEHVRTMRLRGLPSFVKS
jgi:hypothetical protein